MNESSHDLAQLNSLFHSYSANELQSAERNTEAFANEVYDVIDSAGQRYFMKIIKDQLPDVVAVQAQMQSRLETAGIGTPKYIEIAPSSFVGSHESERFTISKYIPGEAPKTVTLKLVEEFGATLARLHQSLEGVAIPVNSQQWLDPRNAKKDLDGYEGELKDTLVELSRRGSEVLNRNLPTAVIHGDLWCGNVFADGDKITTVFDLDTAQETVRILDIARTYTSMRFNSNYAAEQVIERLFAGYDSVAINTLTSTERESFGLAVAYAAGAFATWHAAHGTRYAEPYVQFGREML